MTTDELRLLRDQIDRSFQWWIEYMGLRHWQWQVTYEFERTSDEHAEIDGYICPMEIAARWEYMQFHVRVFLPDVDKTLTTLDRRQHEIDRMVVHELCHALLCELRSEVSFLSGMRFLRHMQHEERVASALTNAFMWVRQYTNEPASEDDIGHGLSIDADSEPERPAA
jgi:hypothetical protein